jgi:hypothetical protein
MPVPVGEAHEREVQAVGQPKQHVQADPVPKQQHVQPVAPGGPVVEARPNGRAKGKGARAKQNAQSAEGRGQTQVEGDAAAVAVGVEQQAQAQPMEGRPRAEKPPRKGKGKEGNVGRERHGDIQEALNQQTPPASTAPQQQQQQQQPRQSPQKKPQSQQQQQQQQQQPRRKQEPLMVEVDLGVPGSLEVGAAASGGEEMLGLGSPSGARRRGEGRGRRRDEQAGDVASVSSREAEGQSEDGKPPAAAPYRYPTKAELDARWLDRDTPGDESKVPAFFYAELNRTRELAAKGEVRCVVLMFGRALLCFAAASMDRVCSHGLFVVRRVNSTCTRRGRAAHPPSASIAPAVSSEGRGGATTG